MKIIKLKMLRNFVDDSGSIILLHEGETYFAIDGGDYWLVQRFLGADFTKVVPKTVKKPHHETVIYTTAEIVPTHTDIEPPCPGCCPGPNGDSPKPFDGES